MGIALFIGMIAEGWGENGSVRYRDVPDSYQLFGKAQTRFDLERTKAQVILSVQKLHNSAVVIKLDFPLDMVLGYDANGNLIDDDPSAPAWLRKDIPPAIYLALRTKKNLISGLNGDGHARYGSITFSLIPSKHDVASGDLFNLLVGKMEVSLWAAAKQEFPYDTSSLVSRRIQGSACAKIVRVIRQVTTATYSEPAFNGKVMEQGFSKTSLEDALNLFEGLLGNRELIIPPAVPNDTNVSSVGRILGGDSRTSMSESNPLLMLISKTVSSPGLLISTALGAARSLTRRKSSSQQAASLQNHHLHDDHSHSHPHSDDHHHEEPPKSTQSNSQSNRSTVARSSTRNSQNISKSAARKQPGTLVTCVIEAARRAREAADHSHHGH